MQSPVLYNQNMDILAGATWVRQFWFQQTNTNNTIASVGGPGWGAEFGLVDPDNPHEVYAVATVANNKAAWVAPGILWVALAAVETYAFEWRRASWYLDLVAPTTSVDPYGYRDTVLRGVLCCSPRAPLHPTVYPTTKV